MIHLHAIKYRLTIFVRSYFNNFKANFITNQHLIKVFDNKFYF